MDISAIVQRLDVTRARIEEEVIAPGVIAVTSAARGDGKSLVATGLAYGLAAVGHSVLLISGNQNTNSGAVFAPKSSDVPFDLLSVVAPGVRGEPSRVSLTSPELIATCSVENVQAAFARLREKFAYTVVDTGVLVESGMAVVLTSESDGIVIAVKAGRGASEADRDFVKVLQSAKKPVLGVVTTQQKAVRAFRSLATRNFTLRNSRSRTADDTVSAALGAR